MTALGAGRASWGLEEKVKTWSKVKPPLPAWQPFPSPAPSPPRTWVFLGHHSTDLPFSEPEGSGQLSFAADGDVAAVVKFLLQLQALVVCVDHPVLVFCPCLACQREQRGGEKGWRGAVEW